MDQLIRKLTLLALITLLLFSCKGLEEPIGKTQLNQQELQEVVFQLEEYKNYVNAFFDMEKQQKARANSLTIEEKQWLTSMLEKYPDPDVLFETGNQSMIKRYNHLTGRDLYHEDAQISKKFQLLTKKLDQNYVYSKIDLADLLIPYTTK